ncbi:entericidin B [Nitrosomonas ureae]|uniref:Entericidin B n=1 Tax=Nitrosomonas ureae TaxID=44577 RepID=A0A286AG87_9PROT|nr:entericidin A/B family lipoprotein [Nitrosomonas ureae]SOD20918.1 entericidin B [Nitrosomonas ureae]
MKALILMITLITITILSACNTLSGIGKDVKKGGQAIENSAN